MWIIHRWSFRKLFIQKEPQRSKTKALKSMESLKSNAKGIRDSSSDTSDDTERETGGETIRRRIYGRRRNEIRHAEPHIPYFKNLDREEDRIQQRYGLSLEQRYPNRNRRFIDNEHSCSSRTPCPRPSSAKSYIANSTSTNVCCHKASPRKRCPKFRF